MAKYIEVINNDNVVSVDDTQARLSLMRSLKLSDIGYDQNGNYNWNGLMHGQDQYCTTSFFRFPIGLGTNEKIFSIRALQDNPHIGFSRLASNTSLSYLYAYTNRFNSIDLSNYVIDFYGYDNSLTGSVGLQIFDANSKLIFNSNKYYFDVNRFYSVQHQDGFAHEFIEESYVFPRNIKIGERSRSNSAVVINNGGCNLCKFSSYYDTPYDMVFTVVFNGTIYLEPRIAFWVNEWSTYTNPTGHIAYPNFSRVSSGIILDTTNIS